MVNEELVNRFREAINKINHKKIKDYGLEEKEQKL